jgi:hypothetical protein
MKPRAVARVRKRATLVALATLVGIGVLAGASGAAAAQPQDDTAKDERLPKPDIEVDDKHDQQEHTSEPGAESPARGDVEPSSDPPKKEDESDPEKKFTLSAYVESFYQWNFNNPGNGISNYRGYDTRHNSLTLQNAVLDAGFRAKDLTGRLAIQFGHGPATYYLQEPDLPGADGAGETNALLWRYLQRASVGWQPSKLLLLEAGLFPTAMGAEGLAVKDNWNWSRSNPSVRLPNYQAGIKATWELDRRVSLVTGVVNGWNNIVDNNDEKSLVLGLQYKLQKKLTASVTYFGGVERSGNAPEGGRPWRHGLEAWGQIDATDWLSFAADGNGGFEDTRFGMHYWVGIAGYARTKLAEWLFVALRADQLWEEIAANGLGASRPFLSPAGSVSSYTGTIDLRPVKGLSTRLELRHDRANDDLYFRGEVQGDGSPENPYLPNTKTQTTALLGVVVWF